MKPEPPSASHSLVNQLPDWLPDSVSELNNDYQQRITCLAENAQWLDTAIAGVKIRVFELVLKPAVQLVAQLRFSHGHSPLPMGGHCNLEMLIQQGRLSCPSGELDTPWYYRFPDSQGCNSTEFSLQRTLELDPQESVLAYTAIGQMAPSDTEWRCIDTSDETRWLPGPVDGVDVLPLHGHGTGNVMLVRWNQTVAFKTRLDPQGEELLVMKGAVSDSQGIYRRGSWIRNPVVAWQSWGAEAGTIVYYKNGHFPALPA